MTRTSPRRDTVARAPTGWAVGGALVAALLGGALSAGCGVAPPGAGGADVEGSGGGPGIVDAGGDAGRGSGGTAGRNAGAGGWLASGVDASTGADAGRDNNGAADRAADVRADAGMAIDVGADTGGAGADARIDSGNDRGAATSPTLAVRFANTVIDRWPDPTAITGVTRGWDYNNGIVLRGMMEVFQKTLDARYLAYIKQYVDTFVDSAGNLYVDAAHTTKVQDQTFSLDVIQPASLLLFLAQQYPTQTKYRTAAALVRNLFTGFPVNGDGGFWHKQTYPNEMWLDGIYMAEPFLVKFGADTGTCGTACNDTPVAQATLLAGHVKLASGLLLHGWDWDHNATWCTGACAGTSGTGLSPVVWSRALGWYAMALVDILDSLPAGHAGRPALLTLLSGLAAGAVATQDATTGLWCQVVDRCGDSGNWIESSGSAMLIYALERGADRGYLDASYRTAAARAWAGLKANKIGSDAVGPIINDAADGMSIQSTYAAYTAIAKRANSYHGLCAVQLAAAAMEYAP